MQEAFDRALKKAPDSDSETAKIVLNQKVLDLVEEQRQAARIRRLIEGTEDWMKLSNGFYELGFSWYYNRALDVRSYLAGVQRLESIGEVRIKAAELFPKLQPEQPEERYHLLRRLVDGMHIREYSCDLKPETEDDNPILPIIFAIDGIDLTLGSRMFLFGVADLKSYSTDETRSFVGFVAEHGTTLPKLNSRRGYSVEVGTLALIPTVADWLASH